MATPRFVHAICACLALLLASCATLSSELGREDSHVVAVKCARLPEHMPWYTTFAEHSWYDIRNEKGWQRIEVISRGSGVVVKPITRSSAEADVRWGDRQVHVMAVYRGAEARRIGAEILAKARSYPYASGYEAWPGPNSNTFVEWLSHQVPGLTVTQYPTAVGKDYPGNGWIDAGITTSRTGVELETTYLGLQVGLVEGVELHLVGLTLGVGLWPPQLKVPFLPGLPWGLAR